MMERKLAGRTRTSLGRKTDGAPEQWQNFNKGPFDYVKLQLYLHMPSFL
jgi:hypothetical protein